MSTSNTSSKVALITGGSKGIGAATAQQLARDGFTVVITYSSDSAPADGVIANLGADKAHMAIKSDASKVADIKALVQEVIDKLGRLDVVVASAGVLPMADLEHLTEATYERTMDLNVRGPYFLAQKAAPHMQPGSRIIFFSTTQCHNANVTANYTLYIASKGAIEQMTRGLAKDLGSKGITVNAVCPGPTATALFLKGKSEQLLNMISNWSPFKQLGKPQDIASVVGFVASDGARWVSGQVIKVNGAVA